MCINRWVQTRVAWLLYPMLCLDLCLNSMFEWDAVPHNCAPYVQAGISVAIGIEYLLLFFQEIFETFA